MRKIDIPINAMYGNLQFKGFLEGFPGKRRGEFLCVCGNIHNSRIAHVISGKTTSCGCVALAWSSKLGKSRKTHGMRHTAIWGIWSGIKDRCTNKNCPGYARYGGRGIRISDRWLSFENFYADMGSRPEGMSIDRIDVNGPYAPANCRWATPKQQSNNRRDTTFLTFNGQTKSLGNWADDIGIARNTLRMRLSSGWTLERVLGTKARLYTKS